MDVGLQFGTLSLILPVKLIMAIAVISPAICTIASHFMIFRRIVLPLSVPAIAAFTIFQFLWVWNDLLVALTFTGGTEGIDPLNNKLAGLAGTWGSHWELLTSSAFVTILVPLVVFFSLQRYFVRGLLAGSVK